jgi:hypothetical protein
LGSLGGLPTVLAWLGFQKEKKLEKTILFYFFLAVHFRVFQVFYVSTTDIIKI